MIRSPTLALPAIVALALGVRLWGITFGLPLVSARPDELPVLHTSLRMHGGDANPHFFDYPALYLYVLAGLFSLYYGFQLLRGRVSDSAEFIVSFRDHFEPFFLIGRTATALAGTATVALCYEIGRTLFGRTAGLVSAFFLALAFLHVRDSHYGTTDVPMTFFVMAATLALVRMYRTRAPSDAWLAGVLAGCASATKYNAVLLVLPMMAVEGVHAWTHRGDLKGALRETHVFRWGLGFTLLFVGTNPYLFLDYQSALRDLHMLQQSTMAGMTPQELLGRGWWYHLPFSLRYGVGAPLLGAGVCGLAWMAYRAPVPALVLGSFPVAYYLAVGAGYNVFVRYMMPVVPFVCVFAGYAVAELVARLPRTVPRGLAAAALSLLIVAPSAHSVVRFNTILAAEDSRLVAGRWMHENVPAGSTICMAGNYGHLQLERAPAPPKYQYVQYDRRAERFVVRGQPVAEMPEWVVVQRSPLPYSDLSPVLQRVLDTEYMLAHTVRAGALFQRGNVYDVQDAFYAPYGGFRGVERAGPNLEIYARRQ